MQETEFRHTKRLARPTGRYEEAFDYRTKHSFMTAVRERILELSGPVLTLYRHKSKTSTIFVSDVRDTKFSLGTHPTELCLHLPRQDMNISLFAKSLKSLSTWMTHLCRVFGPGTVDSFYRFSLRIGYGQRGPVRLAWDKSVAYADEPVAVKEIKADKSGPSAPLDYDLVNLQHPNLVSVLDVFETTSYTHIVMEYVSGGSAQDLFTSSLAQKFAPISPESVMRDSGNDGTSGGLNAADDQLSENNVRTLMIELLKAMEVRVPFIHFTIVDRSLSINFVSFEVSSSLFDTNAAFSCSIYAYYSSFFPVRSASS